MHELALLDGDELLLEKRWKDERDDVERLVPTLQEMLKELGLEKQEITEILAITGPGSFTAVRTGVTFANALAEGLNAKLYGMDTFELLKRKAATTDPVIAILHAGGQDVGVKQEDEIKVGQIAMLLAPFEHNKFKIVSELKETQEDELHSICLEKEWKKVEGHELLTLGESIQTYDLQDLEPTKQVEPLYMKNWNA